MSTRGIRELAKRMSGLGKGLILAAALQLSTKVNAAGTLAPVSTGLKPMEVEDHKVEVVINNGFVKTEVTQIFSNPNQGESEAIYSFPLPESAALSEVTVLTGEKTINGEVVAKEKADAIYEQEKRAGNSAAKAEKNGIQDFRFKVASVKAGETVTVRFVYYQTLDIDTGVARYLYPLEDGGTDDPAAVSFWTSNDTVKGQVSFEVTVKSAWPLESVRSPNGAGTVVKNDLEQGSYQVRYESTSAQLNKDFVFYYKLKDSLPGRVEVIPYKKAGAKEGTFMMVVTPGCDLKPLTAGADYIFVLDVSGSMSGKLKTLTEGVAKALGQMKDVDRFKIVTFNGSAKDMTRGWVTANQQNVNRWIDEVKNFQHGGGTDIYAGLQTALSDLDNDRATSVVLVTDGVTNQGIVKPAAFYKMLSHYDIRLFGFLLGNSSNWPLMRTICEATGGFYAGVSNADDIVGQIMTAKAKVVYECMHNAELVVKGAGIHSTTDGAYKKIHRGEQLVYFGKYTQPGPAQFALKAKLSGSDKNYLTTFTLPEEDTDNPEIERLWALNAIEKIEDRVNRGDLEESESETMIRDIGIEYQIVTDETSMLVLDDATFTRHGIERKNKTRIAEEHRAQSVKRQRPVKNYRVDKKRPAFKFKAPSLGGGGAFGGGSALLMIVGVSAMAMLRRKED